MKKIILGICDSPSRMGQQNYMTTNRDVVKLIIIDPAKEKEALEFPIITLKPNTYNRLSWDVLCDLLCPDNQKYLLVPGDEEPLDEKENNLNTNFMGHRLTPGFSLTRQQRVIMDLLVEGLICKQIAEKLNLSYHTVKHHLSKIYKKIGVKCVSEAVEVYLKYRKRMN